MRSVLNAETKGNRLKKLLILSKYDSKKDWQFPKFGMPVFFMIDYSSNTMILVAVFSSSDHTTAFLPCVRSSNVTIFLVR